MLRTGGYVLNWLTIEPVWMAEFRHDRRAVTAIEYAIIAGVIVAALVVSVSSIGPGLSNIFTKITPEL
jgi:Flp pilus assembly pilin Flp